MNDCHLWEPVPTNLHCECVHACVCMHVYVCGRGGGGGGNIGGRWTYYTINGKLKYVC